MTVALNNKKEWLDKNGKLENTFKLSQISKKWTQDQWEHFLKSTVDSELSENEELSEQYAELLEERAKESSSSSKYIPLETHKLIHYIKNNILTARQREVAEALYWRDLSHRKTAELLKIDESTVREIEVAFLNKFQKILQKHPLTSSYLIGGYENLADKNQTRSQQIKAVYQLDLKGSYLK